MKYHKFTYGDDDHYITIAVSKSKRCKVVDLHFMKMYEHFLGKYIKRSFFRRFVNDHHAERTIMTEDEYLLDLI